MPRLILLFFFILVGHTLSFSATTYKQPIFKQFNSSDGLASSQVYDVKEDKWGYLWFITDNGISRYDGYEFKNFTSRNGLTENIFLKMNKDPNGNIWIFGMRGSLVCINGEKPSFYIYPYNSILEKYRNYIINSFSFSSDGSLFVSYLRMSNYLEIDCLGNILNTPKKIESQQYTVYEKKLNGDKKWIYQRKSTAKSNDRILAQKKINHLNYAGSINHQCYSDNFSLFSTKKCNIQINTNKNVTQLNLNGPFNVISNYNDSTFFIGFRKGGIAIYTLEGKCIDHLLEGYAISNMFCDREGNLWFTTLENGVFVIRNDIFKPFNILSSHNDEVVNRMVAHKNKLYFSHTNGNISIYKNGKLFNLFHSDSRRPSIVKYFPVRKKVYAFFDGKLKAIENYNSDTITSNLAELKNNPYDVLEISDSSILLCNYSKSQQIFPDGKILIGENINRVYTAEEYNNNIFLGSFYGLSIVQNRYDSIYKVSILKNCRVNDLTTFRDYLLVGTNSNGLIVIKKNKAILKLSLDYLQIPSIDQLFVQNNTEVWLSSKMGLVQLKVTPSGKILKTLFNASHGLYNKEVRAVTLFNDTLFVATRGGIYTLAKSQKIENFFPKNSFLSIRKILVNDNSVEKEECNALNYKQNRIEFHYGAIFLKHAENQEYRFKLEGWDEQWNYTKERQVTYKKVAPGNYNFVLQSSIMGTDWKLSEVNIPIYISPPFWKTWWFIGLIITLVITCIYLFFKYRVLIYNADLVRELLRQILKKIKPNEQFIVIEEGNRTIKIPTNNVHFVKSERNYLEIVHEKGKDVVRMKISDFLKVVPDPEEYIQIKRSYIVRIDQITKKENKKIYINRFVIQVGPTYEKELDKIFL